MSDPGRGVTRRRLLAQGGLAGAGLGLGAAGGFAIGRASADDSGPPSGAASVAYYGEHQAGIATPAQDRLHFAAFDLTTSSASEVRDLLRAWTDAAARMTAGLPVGPHNDDPLAPPDDTGEAFGLPPSELTVTFGIGPGVFERNGEDRFGLNARRPPALREVPALPGDLLQPDLSGGDLCVQACANDPQVVFHAVRDLARIARGTAVMRWSQLGFGRTSSTSTSQQTPRNLMGFKDGTLNIVAEDAAAMNRFVWLGEGDNPAWMRGGTYMLTRRIEMLLEVWDRSSLQDQQQTIGRDKYEGAPLGESAEFDPPDFSAKKNGQPVIPADSHVRLAHPDFNSGERIMRRGYSFTDGVIEDLGELDAGLFFICFQRDPERQFAAIQRRLGSHDALNEYIKHTSSAVFAVPPGALARGFVGEGLFA